LRTERRRDGNGTPRRAQPGKTRYPSVYPEKSRLVGAEERGLILSAIVTEGFDLRGETSSLRTIVSQIWKSRDLLVMLAKKDFFARYRRAAFGTAWAVALPLFQAVVLAFVFTHIVRFKAAVNYPTFVFSGILPWTFFSTALTAAATSIVDGQALATKIYFPRAILPLATVASNLFAFLPNILVLFGMELIFGVGIGPRAILLIPATLLMIVVTAAFGLVFSAAHVYFRDVRYILQAGLLAWFWASAVFYPLTLARGLLRTLIMINPVTGIVTMFRAATVGGDPGWTTSAWYALGWVGALLVLAAALHRRFDRVFVDLL
jgi:homopolymeric O-antigen transport system permease protein